MVASCVTAVTHQRRVANYHQQTFGSAQGDIRPQWLFQKTDAKFLVRLGIVHAMVANAREKSHAALTALKRLHSRHF
jgi:hypothetical protein